MDIPLQSPQPPVNMLSKYVVSEETSFTIFCHDKTFKKVTVLRDDNQEGEPLFKVEGTTLGTSWSWRRKLVDAEGQHVCDLRHNSVDIKNGWTVEDPERRKIASLVHTAFIKKGHAAVTAVVRTTAGEDVVVEMEPRDRAALTTTISVGDSTIASIAKVADNRYVFGDQRDRSVWKVKVSAGVDLSLIMVMALVRAEMGHVWKD